MEYAMYGSIHIGHTKNRILKIHDIHALSNQDRFIS